MVSRRYDTVYCRYNERGSFKSLRSIWEVMGMYSWIKVGGRERGWEGGMVE